jgi:flagellum-specific peptidoglycan hydrolase FlgJ
MAREITLAGRRFNVWVLLGLGLGAIFILRKPATQAAGAIVSTIKDAKDRATWVASLYNAISQTLPALGVQSKLIIIAHAILEVGFPPYKAGSAANCNNLFNITTGAAWVNAGKPYCTGGDVTYSNPLPDGSPRPITQKWRSYPTLGEGLLDYWNFLGSRAGLLAARNALEAGDPVQFASLLRDAHYYDAPLATYVAGLKGGINTAKKYLPFLA